MKQETAKKSQGFDQYTLISYAREVAAADHIRLCTGWAPLKPRFGVKGRLRTALAFSMFNERSPHAPTE